MSAARLGAAGRARTWRGPLVLAAVMAVFWSSYAGVRPTNFGGSDEWLLIDLSSRGILDFPYANRPLVLLWTTIAARSWPDDIRAFWLFNGLYLCGAAGLTGLLARRLWPDVAPLAPLASVFAAVWAPLDALRLSGVLSCGYAGFTLSTMAALVLFVESWARRRYDLLALGALLGFVGARGVESVIPVLLIAPLLVVEDGRREGRRLARWTLLWYGGVAFELGLALRPLLAGAPSYQGGALGLDPHPIRVLSRLGQLLGMQATPLVTSSPGELLTPAVPLAVGAFLAFAAAAWGVDAGSPPGRSVSRRAAVRALLLGLLLASAAHAGLALTASVKTPSRTQILSAPGFGLALAGAFVLLGSLLPRRRARVGALALGAWVVAVGTGRTVALQGEWDRFRGVFPEQRQTLRDLVREAPGLEPGTLVVLLDESPVWPMSLSFRHAVAYLYPGQALGLVPDAPDFLYPWSFTPGGIAIWPWPEIRAAWDEKPSLHPWETLMVTRRSGSGRLEILRQWPAGALPPLPAGARYAPFDRIVEGAPPPSRRILGRPEGD